jgi:hypothetical protein
MASGALGAAAGPAALAEVVSAQIQRFYAQGVGSREAHDWLLQFEVPPRVQSARARSFGAARRGRPATTRGAWRRCC